MPEFFYFVRQVYGAQRIYPHGETAELFAQLMDVKTFSRGELELIRDLGFKLTMVSDPRAMEACA